MKLVTGRTDAQAAPAQDDGKAVKPVRAGKSGEGTRSVLEQLLLQENARIAQRKAEQVPADPDA